MIRVRSKNGSHQTLGANFQFVELTDMEGRVAQVSYVVGSGELRVLTAGDDDPAFEAYLKMFNLEGCPVITLKEKTRA